jgi:voltage-dependent anion channel protein 2
LLTKDYNTSGVSLELKTQTPSDVSFKVQGHHDSKTDLIAGNIEGKWADKVNGLTLTQSWTTSNVIRNQVELENLIAKGLKLDLSTSLAPEKGAKTAVLNAVFKQSGFHTRASLDVLKVGLHLTTSEIILYFYFW